MIVFLIMLGVLDCENETGFMLSCFTRVGTDHFHPANCQLTHALLCLLFYNSFIGYA